MSTGTERMQSAQSQLLAAQTALAVEHVENLQAQLTAAIAEGKRIEGEIKRTGAELVKARAEAEPLWTRRESISKARLVLDAEFEKNDFPDAHDTEEYESKRAALTGQWHELTEKIIPLSNSIAALEDQYRGWKVARSRAEIAVRDVRLALADTRRVQHF
jgi:multidrug resistance efflux pump